jgi:hypothetical protein
MKTYEFSDIVAARLDEMAKKAGLKGAREVMTEALALYDTLQCINAPVTISWVIEGEKQEASLQETLERLRKISEEARR